MPHTEEKFQRAVAIMARLRAPGGCPWDREQTYDSIKPYTLEETYEVFDAIERRDWPELKKELGDLLLQVLFYSEMAQEDGHFSIDDVLDALSDKLVSRHPHVFGDVEANNSSEVVRNWEAIKSQEKKAARDQAGATHPHSLLDDVARAMPALIEARKLSSKASTVGFDWPEIGGILDKIKEETLELEEVVARIPNPGLNNIAGARKIPIPEELRTQVEGEIGDLFFAIVNLARHLQIDSESALRTTNQKFRHRFAAMEASAKEKQQELKELSLEQKEELWQRSKQLEGKWAGQE
jgi:ATP diphosphatase